MKEAMELEHYLLNLEKGLLFGSARWIADFGESFRDYAIEDVSFDLYVSGKMRARGFMLSRLASWLLMPNYHAACLAYGGEVDAAKLKKLTRIVADHTAKKEMRWAWLVIPQNGAFTRKVRAVLESQSRDDTVGIALVDLDAQEVTTSPTYLGKRMAEHVRRFK
jgi:hypothetical protein